MQAFRKYWRQESNREPRQCAVHCGVGSMSREKVVKYVTMTLSPLDESSNEPTHFRIKMTPGEALELASALAKHAREWNPNEAANTSH